MKWLWSKKRIYAADITTALSSCQARLRVQGRILCDLLWQNPLTPFFSSFFLQGGVYALSSCQEDTESKAESSDPFSPPHTGTKKKNLKSPILVTLFFSCFVFQGTSSQESYL